MKYLLTALLFLGTMSVATAQLDDDCKPEVVKLSEAVESTDAYDVYGDAWNAGGTPVALNDAIASLDGEETDVILMTSTVSEVCQTKGCWMVLTDDGMSARVHFKDYGFFVPSDITGHKVEVYGSLKEKTISEEQARHYAEDADQDPESITGPQKEYTFTASSVKVYKTN